MDANAHIEQAQSLRRAAIDGAPERWDERADLLNRAVEVARDSDNPSVLADALMALGQLERDRDDLEMAWRRYEDASVVAREHQAPLLLAKALRHLAEMRRESGDLDDAHRFYDEALALYQANGAPVLDIANTYRGIALLCEAQGDNEAALRAWRHAQAGYQAVGVTSGANEALSRLKGA